MNTVTIDINEYNLLRDFKKEIKAGHTITIYGGYTSHPYVYTLDNAVVEIAEVNNKLQKEINELKHPSKKEPSVYELKNMSIWKLLKWRIKL